MDVLDTSGLTILKNILKTILNRKVDTEDGKGLSSNDYTDDEKAKLNGVQEGAQVNSITGIKGDAETSYRTGNVNITPSDIGALPASDKGQANGVAPLNENGQIEPTYLSGMEIFQTPASKTKLGVVLVGDNLTVTEDGTLSVDVADSLDAADTRPVTAGAVYEVLGDIETMLSSI